MSNFRSKAFNPASKRVEDAEYCDDYYGRHRYGIRFDDGCVHPEAQCGIDAAATQLDALLKERDALQARVKELEFDIAGFRLINVLYKNSTEAAESRATRLQQERDEAYERAEKEAGGFYNENPEDEYDDGFNRAAVMICAAIRRLAGPEKEKKE